MVCCLESPESLFLDIILSCPCLEPLLPPLFFYILSSFRSPTTSCNALSCVFGSQIRRHVVFFACLHRRKDVAKIRQTCVSKVIVFCVTPLVPESFMIYSIKYQCPGVYYTTVPKNWRMFFLVDFPTT